MKRLVLYAHFDDSDKIQDYVVHALNSMHKVSDAVIFISTSNPTDTELDKIAPYIKKSILTENVGYDFFMWKQGLHQVDYKEYDEIILSNSSVYGPLWDISTVLNTMNNVSCDFWGITESYELEWHLQSYFIAFRKGAHNSLAFKNFWDSVLPYSNKSQVIRSYEIGLSQWLIGNGLKASVYCSWKQLAKFLLSFNRAISNKPVNPSITHPVEIIKLGVPFLKLEVIRDNPSNCNVNQIISLLHDVDYSVDYLMLNAPKRSPRIKAESKETCPLCGHSGAVMQSKVTDCLEVNSGTRWTIRRCLSRKCGSAWLDPAPLEPEIYQSYYTHEAATREYSYYPTQYSLASKILLNVFRKALKLTGIHKKRTKYWLHDLERGSGRLLEIGCGDGSRLLALQASGWEVEGQEVDPKAVQHCLAKGLQVHEGPLDSISLQENTFDVILLSHVLEHIHRPKEFLDKCRSLLKSGGRLLITTPNVDSLGHKIYRRCWRPLEVPWHIIIYTPKSISNILQEVGFIQVSVRTIALNFELISMHSRDIKYLGWTTDVNSMPRVNNELVPVMMQFVAMMVHLVSPHSGEECFAIAVK